MHVKKRCRVGRREEAVAEQLNAETNVPHGAEQRTVTFLLQRLDGLVRECLSCTLETVEAGVEVCEGEFETEAWGEGFEDAAAGGDDFAADAVAGDEA